MPGYTRHILRDHIEETTKGSTNKHSAQCAALWSFPVPRAGLARGWQGAAPLVSACRKTVFVGTAPAFSGLDLERWPGRAAATALMGVSPRPMLMGSADNAVTRSIRKYHCAMCGIIARGPATARLPELVFVAHANAGSHGAPSARLPHT